MCLVMAGEGDWLLEVALAKGGNAKNAPMTRGEKDGNEPRLCDVRKLESTGPQKRFCFRTNILFGYCAERELYSRTNILFGLKQE